MCASARIHSWSEMAFLIHPFYWRVMNWIYNAPAWVILPLWVFASFGFTSTHRYVDITAPSTKSFDVEAPREIARPARLIPCPLRLTNRQWTLSEPSSTIGKFHYLIDIYSPKFSTIPMTTCELLCQWVVWVLVTTRLHSAVDSLLSLLV